MSKSLKSILAIGFIAVVAACAQPAEEEFVVVEPITPASTSKPIGLGAGRAQGSVPPTRPYTAWCLFGSEGATC